MLFEVSICSNSYCVADVVETDTVTYNGTDYAVDGQIERWRTGNLPHDVVRLKAVAG